MRIRPILTVVLPALVAGVASASAAPIFTNLVSDTGRAPIALVAQDFNGDGILDAAIGNQESDDVSILIGRGDGTFEPQVLYPLPRGPSNDYQVVGLLAGRFNDDSFTDLVVFGNFGTVVLAGHGDGTFTPAGTSPFAAVQSLVATGDFNGDGLDDVVGGVSGLAQAKILLNVGGGFAAPATVNLAAPPYGIAAGDFDGDGRIDLLSSGLNNFAFQAGNGNGTFGPPVPFGVGAKTTWLTTVDLNADGHLDVVGGTNNTPLRARVLLGNGSGGFALHDVPTHAFVSYVTIADLDDDAIPDLIVGEQTAFGTQQTGLLEVFRGVGDGSFGPPSEYGVGRDVRAVAAGDFDGDGDTDLTATFLDQSRFNGPIDGLAFFPNRGDGTCEERSVGAQTGLSLGHADFDSDGNEDLVMKDSTGLGVVVLLGQGDGTFEPETGPYPTGDYGGALVIADFNSDTHPDIAVANGGPANVVTVRLGIGDGTFGPATAWPGGEGHQDLVAGDFTHDGAIDLVVTNDYFSVSLLPGLGDGRFGTHSRWLAVQRPKVLAASDLNDDGLLDLLVRSDFGGSGPRLVRLLGTPGGGFSEPVELPPPLSIQSLAMRLEDLDGDGREDLLTPGAGSRGDELHVQRGLPDGTFGPLETIVSDRAPWPPAAADFDGDGRIDLAIACTSTGDITIHRGMEGGGLGPKERYASRAAYELVAADFNNDGRPDLALQPPGLRAQLLINRSGADGVPPVADAGVDVAQECTSPSGTVAHLDGGASTGDIVAFEWFEHFGGPGETTLGTGATLDVTLALGMHAITLKVTDGDGLTDTDDVLFDVVDTTPPAFGVLASPSILWPPNHRLVPVQASLAAADACGSATVALVSVTSSEPDDAPGAGDGMTSGDIQGADLGAPDVSFLLRAERDSQGSGRVYTATWSATDGRGNAVPGAATISVPLQRNGTAEPVILQVLETPAGTRVSWGPVAGAVSYDVVRGTLDLLRGAPGAPAPVCVAAGLASLDNAGSEDPVIPAAGAAFVYLVQYFDPSHSGYGTESAPYDISGAFPSLLCP